MRHCIRFCYSCTFFYCFLCGNSVGNCLSACDFVLNVFVCLHFYCRYLNETFSYYLYTVRKIYYFLYTYEYKIYFLMVKYDSLSVETHRKHPYQENEAANKFRSQIKYACSANELKMYTSPFLYLSTPFFIWKDRFWRCSGNIRNETSDAAINVVLSRDGRFVLRL